MIKLELQHRLSLSRFLAVLGMIAKKKIGDVFLPILHEKLKVAPLYLLSCFVKIEQNRLCNFHQHTPSILNP